MGVNLKWKFLSGLMLTLFMLCILIYGYEIKPAKSEWTGTVYIRADGSIDPPDAPITTYDNVTYTLTSNITSSWHGIIVYRNNIIIDGAGYTLKGTGTYNGMSLASRGNVTVKNMRITNFYYGVYIEDSSNNCINGNVISNNRGCGIQTENSSNNVIATNCIANNGKGISIIWGSSNNIQGNNIVTSDLYGIILTFSSSNVISNNNITANDSAGIYISGSLYNIIAGNNISANNLAGICLDGALYNNISRNDIINNEREGYLVDGLHLADSFYNDIIGNNIISNQDHGIYLFNSSSNIISGNIIANNSEGIDLFMSPNNLIFHNNFLNNSIQADESWGYNTWDNGYPSGGNYWSDYTGVDSNGDGIGDAPYAIDVNNVDRYPLMGPFNSFDTSVGCPVDVISNSTIEDFRYFESNSTIIMHVSNMTVNQTVGFCRLTIPHDVMSPPYTVKVNGTEVECKIIYENYTEEISIIYFTYEHSKLEIVVIQEFPFNTMLSTFLMLLTISLIFTKKLLHKKANKIPHV